jgi:hypothetical protein
MVLQNDQRILKEVLRFFLSKVEREVGNFELKELEWIAG